MKLQVEAWTSRQCACSVALVRQVVRELPALPAGGDAAAAATTWRSFGPLWPKPGGGASYENCPDYAMTVCGAAAYAVRAREGVVRICLRSGVRDKLHGSGAADTREAPMLWPAADCDEYVVRLRLWGGEAPLYEAEGPRDAPRGTDMLLYQHSAWGASRATAAAPPCRCRAASARSRRCRAAARCCLAASRIASASWPTAGSRARTSPWRGRGC